jgi:hypothetical protein
MPAAQLPSSGVKLRFYYRTYENTAPVAYFVRLPAGWAV